MWAFRIAFLMAVASCLAQIVESQRRDAGSGPRITEILDGLLKGYDKRVRPNYGVSPVSVGVTMYILSISSVSELNMDFTVDFYFRQTWQDPRLKFQGPPQTLIIDADFLKNLWIPDTFFVNEKNSNVHSPATASGFVRISQDGTVLRSIRLTATATCPMDLRYFPMDSQVCGIEIESFGHQKNDIEYKWAESSHFISDEVSLYQFNVAGYRQREIEISLTTGNYSRLVCDIQFVRSFGHYWLQIYNPSIAIVLISWVAFWLDRKVMAGRIALAITTILTMVILLIAFNASLPKVSYTKAIDVYVGVCFTMIFFALLESATVGYVSKGASNNVKDEEGSTTCGAECSKEESSTHFRNLFKTPPASIDKFSRIAFPIFFIVFNILYWVIYLTITDVEEEDMIKIGE